MTEIARIWSSGGWVMVPLFALGALLYAEAFSIYMLVRRVDPGDDQQVHWFEWVRDPEKSTGRVGALIRHVQSNVTSAKQVRDRFDEIRLALVDLIDRRTRFLGMLVSAAPLLGLLGTVLGMLQTFLGIATSGGAETSAVVASGISEALVTTQTGLTIALPGLFFVMTIQRRKHGLEARLARLESLTLGHLRFE